MATYKTFQKGFLVGQPILYVTSDFGKRNINGKIQNHNGIDFGVPQGTILNAPLSGKIVKRSVQKNGAGLYVTLRHWVGEGVFIDILFMHLHSVESYINVGYDIIQGQKIGTTGGATGDKNAGHSTGPHLHLEIRNYGSVPVDPKYWFLAKEKLIAKKTNAVLNYGDQSWLSFDSSSLKTQTSYKYSKKTDITVESATEYSKNDSKERAKAVETLANERFAPGIWQIVKLVIDSSVEEKQVLDSGISTQQGSLLNFFRKVCQEPLVEFAGDTFGNQYYWYVRKPPFDKESFQRMIDLTTIELKSDEILTTDLSWNNQGIYSWYQYIPYADLLGFREANLFMPAVFFPEYASVWGSRPLAVESNYFNFAYSGRFNSDKDENKQNGDRILRNALRDFKYLIESNAYNPFTRRGTITIIGDRRIKRGTLIMHTSGELFYVDSVTNNYEVNVGGTNRTTTLNVSKGMFPAYIYGKDIGGKKMSYFDIIDFGKDFDIEKVTSDNWKNIISKWRVNTDSFGFFMSKQQVFWENINLYRNETGAVKSS
jgi:hypothetical protein